MKKAIKSKISVLAYHKTHNKENFTRQIQYLKQRYSLISLHQLERFLLNNGRLPQNPLLITFDDGDSSLYRNAFPVLKKEKAPAVIFVVTGLLNSKKPFWWDEMEYHLGKETGNKKAWEVKTWPNKEREEFLENMRLNSGKKDLEYPQLTTSQLKEMNAAGIVIANHSHTHPMFDQCTTDELQSEMQNSIKTLNYLGLTPDAFAYPNGNYAENAEKILKENGIKLAFLFDHQLNKKGVDPLRISRLVVNDTTPMWKYKFILSGWHSKFLPAIKRTAKLIKRN